MFKFRLMIENVAEKVFGRLLPQVEAKAGHSSCSWMYDESCCENNTKKKSRLWCFGNPTSQTKCEGVCVV